MKTACVIFLVFVAIANPAHGAIELLRSEGTFTFFTKKNGIWTPMTGTNRLAAPVQIKTGSASLVDVDLGAGALIRVQPNSVVVISEATVQGETNH